MDFKDNQATIKKIKAYLHKNGAPYDPHFDATVRDIFAILYEVPGMEGVDLAFRLGRAKGYRQAMRDMEKKKSA